MFSEGEIRAANDMYIIILSNNNKKERAMYMSGEIRMYVEMQKEIDKLKEEIYQLNLKNNSNFIQNNLKDYTEKLPFTEPKIK